MNLSNLPISPRLVAAVVAVLLLALLVFRWREGSRRGAKKRLRGGSKRATTAAGFGALGILGAFAGAADGTADIAGQAFGILGNHAGFLSQGALAYLSFKVADGTVSLDAGAVGLLAVAIIALGVAWSRS